MATSKRGEIAALQRAVRDTLADRTAAVRPLSGLPPVTANASGRSSGKRLVPTR
jgi:hypothetical protein